MMAGIRAKDTKPEIFLRRALHRRGFRFRLHVPDLPGKPDLVFPKFRAVLFAHGCFWHRHQCHLFKWPKSREAFWREKIDRNVDNDTRILDALNEMGWRVGTVWECALKGRARLDQEETIQRLSDWLLSVDKTITIQGG
jgi:DNA mismatch endonuclease (patch repair protein)